MDYYLLTDLTAQLGYELAVSGAETFRVEETMQRVLRAYGVESQVYSIPNCIMVSLEAANGKPLMVMKRIGYHGNDLDAVERLSALSRRLCAETPEVDVAAQWLEETVANRRSYGIALSYLGHFLVAAGFCPVFGGTPRDCLWAGALGLIIGLVTRILDRLEVNPFFSTIAAAFAAAIPAYLGAALGVVDSPDAAIIGALMLLVPGLLITNSMRDIIYGDTNSGINRIVQVLLSALAIAMGTAGAWHLTSPLYGAVTASALTYPAWVQCAATGIACMGFVVLFNVHGGGRPLCALGGALTWMVYLLCGALGFGIYGQNFFAAIFAAAYAETMARIRKYPVTSYQVISAVPLLPGAGIYYTMSLGLGGSMQLSLEKGLQTAGVAGALAAAILLVSTLFRLYTTRRKKS